MTQNQGIVAILGSDNHEKAAKAASLRRTLSADMSSKRWLSQNDFSFSPSPLKKIASSENMKNLAPLDSSPDEDEEEYDLNMKPTIENPRQVDIWTSIMSQNAQQKLVTLPPPYIHPLVKKSASSLSKDSLEVCTESLGSETGSDVLSSRSSASDSGGENQRLEQLQDEEEEVKDKDSSGDGVVKHSHPHLTTKKAQQARSLPPPIPSLAVACTDGTSLHMHSHRVDGHFVLEAISIPSQKYFEAQRQDGRFLLTLINDPNNDQAPHHDLAVEFEDIFQEDEIYEVEEEEDVEEMDEIKGNFHDKDMGILKEQAPNLTVGAIKLHKSTVTMKKIRERDNRNLSWPSKLNKKVVKVAAAADTAPPPTRAITRVGSLPPLPPSPPTPLNTYQYFWRAKPTVASVIDPLITQRTPPAKNKAYEKKDLVLMRGNKADCLLPSLNVCKKPRRSLLMWEPFCIATS